MAVDVAPDTRRRMQAVRQKDTRPEVLVRKLMHRAGFRFRLHRKDLPGTPDIVLPARRKVILVHGCFWHGHEACRRSTLPSKNSELWVAKIKGNRDRDARQIEALQHLGWSVRVVWECELHDAVRLEERLVEFLRLR